MEKEIDKKNAVTKYRGARLVTFRYRMWYRFCWSLVGIFLTVCFFLRHKGNKNIPGKGPVLVVSNHQSFLDPPAVGCGVFRRMNYLARKTLFKFKPFGWLIDSVNAIPLDQEGIGYAGIKETLRRLKNDEMVLIFPEGARSEDGEIAPFRTGYIALAVRSRATIVPAAIAGAFEAFPRNRKLPIPFIHPIRVEYGKPLRYEDYQNIPEDELHTLVENRVRELYEKIRKPRKENLR